MMKSDNPFLVVPPAIMVCGEKVQLRPLAALSWRIIQQAAELSEEHGDAAIVLGYIATHSLPPATVATLTDEEYKTRLDALAMEITLDDLQAAADYIAGVAERADAARVSTPEKQEAG